MESECEVWRVEGGEWSCLDVRTRVESGEWKVESGECMNPKRVYVEMRVNFSVDGTMMPVHIKWEDGLIYEIDRVLDVRRSASAAGSMGIRYTVRIMGHERRIFFEDTWSDTGRPRWFVES